MVELWYPIIAIYLNSTRDQESSTSEFVLEFKEMKGVAHTVGNRITISKNWIHQHPDDIGMVLHEMVHVIQAYPPQKDHGWLVEGMADYIRFWMAEPAGQPVLVRGKNHYRQGYRVTAAWLDWIQRHRFPLVIQELNLAFRNGSFDEGWFLEKTGKDPDTLWAEFLNHLEQKEASKATQE